MLFFITAVFALFWIAYRHNYYFVQRVKVDTNGLLFENALSQLFAGIYVLEIALIGLFFLVRNSAGNVACTPQAIIMIIALCFTAGFHYTLEVHLRPLYELLPVSLEDAAADEEKRRFLLSNDSARSDEVDGTRESNSAEFTEPKPSMEPDGNMRNTNGHVGQQTKANSSGLDTINSHDTTKAAADARRSMLRLRRKVAAKLENSESHALGRLETSKARRIQVADQLGAAIAGYPDELSDLSLKEQEAEHRAAYQDPITREPAPVIWIPQDPAGVSDDMIKQADKYGQYLQYSNAGAYLTSKNKCEITRPAPDVRPDWLLDWWL